MKKFLIAAIMISLLLLSACGAKPAEAPAEAPAAQPEAPAAEQSAPAEAPAPAEVPVEEEKLSDDDFLIASLGDDTCKIKGCHSELKNIVVPETLFGYKVVGVAMNGFVSETAETVTLPDTVEFLDENAFSVCPKLKSVELGAGLKRVGTMAFNSCDALESLSFPEGMTTMDTCPIGACASLKEVYIPASVTEIEDMIITRLVVCPNIVIVTPAGSVAEAAAANTGLPVENR